MRHVSVDVALLESARDAILSGRDTSMRINPSDDTEFVAVLERMEPTLHGFSLSGTIADDPSSTAVLVVNGHVVAGVFNTGFRTWTLSYRGSEGHVVTDSPAGFECETDHVMSSALATASARASSDSEGGVIRDSRATDSGDDDGSEVDVLVLYTTAARRRAGGLDAMRAYVDLAVATANNALHVGGADLEFNLVGAAEVAYDESGSGVLASSDRREIRDRLQAADDGYLDEAHVLRERYAADAVNLIINQGGSGGGIAYISPLADKPESYAFSVTGLTERGIQPHLIAHELGHVLGLRHDRYVDHGNTPYPYSHGYVNQRAFDPGAPVEKRWSTIMAYQTQCVDANFHGREGHCPNVLRFSNPRQVHPVTGDPIGVPGDEPSDADDGPADAIRSLNNTRAAVAQYRDSSERCEYDISVEDVVVDAAGTSLTATVSTNTGCGWDAWSPEGFLGLQSNAGNGPGQLRYRVDANVGGARLGHLIVGGETLVVKQRGAIPVGAVCDRTPGVRDAIVAAVSRDDCSDVDEFDLLGIGHLQLSSQDISELDADDFDGLTNLVTLDISRNNIAALPSGLFDPTSSLERLDFSWNGITEVHADLLSNLTELKYLSFAKNTIEEVPSGFFAGMSELQEIHLNLNAITRLPDEIFADQAALRFLSLGYNSITGDGLSKGVFRGLDQLTRLDLSGNPLGDSLPEDVFVHLGSLVQIYLGNAQLSSIPRFYNDMSWVDADRNRIASLDGVSISGRAIAHLNLAENQLEAIPDAFFVGYSSVHCNNRNFQLQLQGNPGAPFGFQLELVRFDAPPAAPGPAEIGIRLGTGAPLPLTAGLEVEGGATLSASTLSIENGTVEGAPVEVRGDATVVLHLTNHSSQDLPATYQGIEIELGEPLRLFALENQALEVGEPFTLDLFESLSRPGDPLSSFVVTTGDDAVATVSLTGSVLTVDPVDEGTTTITITARDALGATVTRQFTVTVGDTMRSIWRGWRLQLLHDITQDD